MKLGQFGAAQRELYGEKDDFDFMGENFIVERPLPAVLMLQLGAGINGKVDETEGLAAMWEALRISLTTPVRKDDEGNEVAEDPSQFLRFYRVAVDQSCDIESLSMLVMKLFEAQTGKATRQASASSVGPVNTSTNSSTSSTHPALGHLRSIDDLVAGPSG